MGRRTTLATYNPFTEQTTLSRIKDDRAKAKKINSPKQLELILPKRYDRADGAIGSEIRSKGYASYNANKELVINPDKIKAEANALKQETLGARFYPQNELDRELDDNAEKYNISVKKARNLRAREYQVKAQAILTSAKAGKVEIDANTKGILNTYARGDYEQAIYGIKDEATGKRTYERGRYFSELGFAEAERKRERGGRGGSATKAGRDEKRREFLQNVVNRGS